jgi:uncharacterized protein YbaR (Trm112 family)
MIDPELLAVLCCPDTRQPVRIGTVEELHQINASIQSGQCRNRGGNLVGEAISGLLVREDGQYGYPIREDIPMMLKEEAVPLSS